MGSHGAAEGVSRSLGAKGDFPEEVMAERGLEEGHLQQREQHDQHGTGCVRKGQADK